MADNYGGYGLLLERFRLSSGKSARDLARYLGFSVVHVRDVERLKRPPFAKVSDAMRAALWLGIPPFRALRLWALHRRFIAVETPDDPRARLAVALLALKAHRLPPEFWVGIQLAIVDQFGAELWSEFSEEAKLATEDGGEE